MSMLISKLILFFINNSFQSVLNEYNKIYEIEAKEGIHNKKYVKNCNILSNVFNSYLFLENPVTLNKPLDFFIEILKCNHINYILNDEYSKLDVFDGIGKAFVFFNLAFKNTTESSKLGKNCCSFIGFQNKLINDVLFTFEHDDLKKESKHIKRIYKTIILLFLHEIDQEKLGVTDGERQRFIDGENNEEEDKEEEDNEEEDNEEEDKEEDKEEEDNEGEDNEEEDKEERKILFNKEKQILINKIIKYSEKMGSFAEKMKKNEIDENFVKITLKECSDLIKNIEETIKNITGNHSYNFNRYSDCLILMMKLLFNLSFSYLNKNKDIDVYSVISTAFQYVLCFLPENFSFEDLFETQEMIENKFNSKWPNLTNLPILTHFFKKKPKKLKVGITNVKIGEIENCDFNYDLSGKGDLNKGDLDDVDLNRIDDLKDDTTDLKHTPDTADLKHTPDTADLKHTPDKADDTTDLKHTPDTANLKHTPDSDDDTPDDHPIKPNQGDPNLKLRFKKLILLLSSIFKIKSDDFEKIDHLNFNELIGESKNIIKNKRVPFYNPYKIERIHKILKEHADLFGSINLDLKRMKYFTIMFLMFTGMLFSINLIL